MPLLVLYNPVSGDGAAKVFFEEQVFPLLQRHNKQVDKMAATQSAEHAGQALFDFLESVQGPISIILGSGDGTLHDIINFLSAVSASEERTLPELNFALVPCGTANALYSSLFPPPNDFAQDINYKLLSVKAFLDGSPTVPLSLAITRISSSPTSKNVPKVAVSSVVVSTSLHACILKDSESLRAEMPGIERFKVAAQNNSKNWYNSYVKLLPCPLAGLVQIYNPATRSFIEHPESVDEDPIVDIYGPFVYFLATVNVDRLEPKFRITPLARSIPPSEATFDLIILRPLRDPKNTWNNPTEREAYVSKVWHVLGSAYNEGAHIDLRYNAVGDIVTDGDGPTVVEYIRCGGWEWIPDDLDERAHLLCADGTIFKIEKGGRAISTAAIPNKGAGFAVYV